MRVLLTLAIMVIASASNAQDFQPRSELSFDGCSIKYDGEVVRLSKCYHDYDVYKNDPNNVSKIEYKRVEILMTRARISHSFATRAEAINAVVALMFPGYGVWGIGPENRDTSLPTGTCLEIPGAAKNRCVIIGKINSEYAVLDDFSAPERLELLYVERQGATLVYKDRQKRLVAIRPIFPDAQAGGNSSPAR
jgi:hypothetical protein